MKRIKHTFKTCALLLLSLLAGYSVTQAQVINGGFDQNTPGWGGCPAAVWQWTQGGPPGNVQWENQYDNGNWWLDITGCGWGNGRWVQQGVPTVVGQTYRLTFDLGCWNGQYHTDAGAILTVNGVSQGRYAHTTFTGTSTAPLAWKKFDYCFTATTTTTTIRFTADGLPTSFSPPGTTVANVGVIGLDNVKMTADLDSTFKLDYVRNGCNYCFQLINPFAPQAPRPYATNIKWYLNNGLAQNGDTTYCVNLTPGNSYTVKVIFDIVDACGVRKDTLSKTVLADYMVVDGGVINLTSGCNGNPVAYTPGCTAPYNRFEMTGPSYSTSGPLPAPVQYLTAGTYTLTCYDDARCTKKVTTVIVTNSTTITTTYCTLYLDNCDQLNDNEVIREMLHAKCPECAEVFDNATSVGPIVFVSYNPVTQEQTVTREYYDATNCRKCIVTFVMKIKVTNCSLYLEHCSQLNDDALILEMLYAKCPECAEVAANATSIGPIVYVSYDPATGLQTVTREYFDAKNCRKCIVTFVMKMSVTRCTLTLENCDQLNDNALIQEMLNANCPECAEVFANATSVGPLVFVSYDPATELQTITREYFDAKNCRKCIVTFMVKMRETTCEIDADCKHLTDEDLIKLIQERCEECGAIAANATWVGPLETGYYDYGLGMQIMTREYIDLKSCHRCRVTIRVKMDQKRCDIELDNCDPIRNPDAFKALVSERCPDCAEMIGNPSVLFKEWNPYYDQASGQLILTYEYFDFERCRKCLITVVVHHVNVPVISVSTGREPCITLKNDDLIRCLREGNIKVIPYAEPYPGDQTAPVTYPAGQPITLCCRGRDNNRYYLYSETDPCCAMIVELDCSGVSGGHEGRKEVGGSHQLSADLKLVPNPASAVFRISAGNAKEDYKLVEVVDMNGKVLLTRTNADSQTKIDMTQYSAGIYGVKVITATGRVVTLKLTLVK